MQSIKRLQSAMMIWVLGAMAAAGGVTAHTETWDATAAGWVDRDANEMTVAHSALAGNPAGALGGQFAAQEVPVPETDAFRATGASSGGAFTGDYWLAGEGSFFGWRFDFYAADVLPSVLLVRFGGAGHEFFADVKPQVGDTGSWYSVQAPAAYGDGWMGGTEAQWSNALASVEFVEVQVTRSGAGAQTYYVDNFSNRVVRAIPPAAPVAGAATDVATTSFSANWEASAGATNYFLDVATDSEFASYVSGYQDLAVGDVTTVSVTGLSAGSTYYYRVRAQNSGGTSENSGTITVTAAKAAATVELLNLTGQVYDGLPKTVIVVTDPENLTVDVTYDGSPAAPIAAGSYAVTGTVNEANYEGSAAGTLVIDMADQSIGDFLPADARHFYQSDAVGLSATASSGGAVTFAVFSGPGHIEGARLTFTGAGEVQVVASQSGDGNYNPAPAVTHTYTVHEDLALELSRTAVNVREAGEGRFFVRMAAAPIVKTTVTVSRIDGDASLVLKSGATLVFKPSNWSVWQTVTLGQAADDGNSINEQATFAVSMVGEEDQLVVATALDDDGLGSNLALATAGSAIAGSYAARAIDSVHTSSANYGYTIWTNVPPGTMVLDLKDAATVSRIRLLNWDWGYRVHQYKIEKSLNGSDWTPLVDSGAGAQRGWDDWAVGNESIRYLKFTGLSNSVNTSVCIPEWEVYGTPALKPAPVVGKPAVNVRENGEGRFFVKLARKPGASTLVTVASGEGGDADLTVKNGGTLTFTPANWSTWQVVTLAAADDMDAANGTATINVSYAGSAVAEVTATELDDDLGPNLALGSAITGKYNGARMIDGLHLDSANYGYTIWTSVPPTAITLDLKSTATVARIRLLNWDWSYRLHQYKIESSTDGSIWTELVNSGAGAQRGWDDWAVPEGQQSLRYLRFSGLSNSINPAVCISEWEVYGPAPGRRSLAPANTSALAQESKPASVLTSDGPEDASGWNALDGDPATAWVGQKAGGGYLVVGYEPILQLKALEVDLAEGSLTNIQYLYSLDAQEWQPLPEDMQSHPVSLNYLWLLFPDDGTTAAPGVLEIRPNP